MLLGSNQSLRLKQCGTIRLGKSAHPNPLLVLAFLSLCVCFPFWICRQDYISSVILRSHLNQSCWKYLICFLNHDSDSLLLKAAGGGGGGGREEKEEGSLEQLIPSTSGRLLQWFDQALGVTEYGTFGIQSRQLSAAKLAIHLHSSVYK